MVRSLIGWIRKEDFSPRDNQLRIWTLAIFDLQVLVGVFMYTFLSPTVHSGIMNMGEVMKDAQLRFFVFEHATGMITALIIFHVGNVWTKRTEQGFRQHKCLAITLILVTLVTLASIPWPGLPYGRIFFRGF